MDECQELKENGLLFTEDRYRPAIEDFKKASYRGKSSVFTYRT